MTNLWINRYASIIPSAQRTEMKGGRSKNDAEDTFSAILASQMKAPPISSGTDASERVFKYEFPPAKAPIAFKEAWKSATEGMDPGVRMTYELEFWGNLHPEFSRISDSTPVAAPSEGDLTSYQSIILKFLESLDTRPELYARDQLQKNKAFFGKLKQMIDLKNT